MQMRYLIPSYSVHLIIISCRFMRLREYMLFTKWWTLKKLQTLTTMNIYYGVRLFKWRRERF